MQQYGWTWETPGTASAKAEDLLPDWEVDTGGFMASSTCKIIDKIAGGETKMRTEDQVITQFNMRLIRAVMPQERL